jgi:sn-glycerol 3-phosphate transport system substrate-binding protein
VNGDFIEGRAAMIWTSTAYIRYFEDNAKFAFATAPLPKKVRHSVPTGGTFFVMPRGTPVKQQRAAAAFLAFMLGPEQANRFATETGYIPTSRAGLRDLESSGYFAQHPNHRVAIDQLASSRGFPWARSLLRVEREIVQPHLEEAVLGKKNAREALTDAQHMALEDS